MSKKISYTGTLLALNLIILTLSNIVPINNLFFMGIASLLVSIVIMEFGINYGIIFSIASIILSFFIIPSKVRWGLYIFTFAIYGILKYLIEKNKNPILSILLKLIISSFIGLILYFILNKFVLINMNLFNIFIFEIAFFVYDYVYTLFIEYYNDKIKNMLRLK